MEDKYYNTKLFQYTKITEQDYVVLREILGHVRLVLGNEQDVRYFLALKIG